MGRLHLQYLEDGTRKYACKECLAGLHGGSSIVHLAAVNDLLSKSFHSRHGPAYLFNAAVNVTLGSREEREMTTGRHVVRDLFCVSCNTNLGWRYELAHENREKYKEGKYILERLQLVDLDASSAGIPAAPGAEQPAAASAAIASASPGSSPGTGYGGPNGFLPPRHLYQATPLRPVRASDPEELRAFFCILGAYGSCGLATAV